MNSSWRHARAAAPQRAASVPPLPGTRPIALAAALVAAALVAACGGNGDTEPDVDSAQATRAQATAADLAADNVQTLAKTIPPAPVYDDWPAITSSIPKDPAIESRVAQIVASMTLEQKIGQMTQPEIKSVTPDQVRQYFIGSVLNGGGSWPNGNKRAASSDWVALADQYYNASMSTTMATKVPIIWGTDAIHGHSNVYQATLFPHNIGLGAAHDPGLVKKIGASVGKAVRSTGINWVFAPTLAVAQDDRWGRTYESFSEDASIVRAYAGSYISGLQGTFATDANVVATAKHFMGDGGTDQGTDQGVNMASKDVMINVHGQGYYTALEAGAQTVMASFNSWTNPSQGINEGKMHGSKYMLTDVLKTKMLFDGFVVSDWNGIGQVPGCTNASCAQAINAGIDMVMVPDEWRAFISNTVAQVNSGAIPMSRINDAVTRILRVKMRAGMFNGRKPSQTAGAGDPQQLQARSLARQAVRKSLVLLKNNDAVLPLARGKKTLVVGKSANSMANQTGGWSLTWQGTGNSNADFAGISDTILSAIQQVAGADKVDYSETGAGKNVADYDVVIAVIGETPYAEGAGDINASKTLAHSRNYPEDLAALNTVSGKGKPVVTLLLSGRPVYANDLINKSDAFVAAWLPGTEGRGVTDVLYRNAKGNVDFDFTGSLSFSWPKDACQTPLNKGDGQEPQFALGYGQKYTKPKTLAQLPTPAIPNTCSGGAGTLMIFNQVDYPPFALTVNAEANNWQNVKIGSDLNAIINVPSSGNPAIRVQTTQINTQQDAKQVTWFSHSQFFSQAASGQDLSIYTDGTLEFDWMVAQAPSSTVKLQMDCGYPCRGSLDITSLLRSAPLNTKQTVKVPLSCFASAGATLGSIDTPFSIESLGTLKLSLTQMKVVKGGASSPDALSCSQLGSFAVFGPNGPAPGFSVTSWQSANNFVSYQVMPAGTEPAEIRAQYANTSGANGMVYLAGGPVDLTPMQNGSFAVELYPYLYGSNTTDFTLKLESGPGCSTADITLGKPAQGAWSNVSVPMSTVLAGAAGCFDLSKVNYVGVFPRWNQQAGVQMTMRNLRFLQ
ncbi:glycoside hydrolase family 3 N-terminal domain-containing protein [Ideonella sp. DXS29W]|uniref:Glycoside hydrolase family 3 N-terminal domain-containing protein n=1 Tax=Ideonella lacteola TaxID=2984193 RepID=A0ABU9BVI1_9BURK